MSFNRLVIAAERPNGPARFFPWRPVHQFSSIRKNETRRPLDFYNGLSAASEKLKSLNNRYLEFSKKNRTAGENWKYEAIFARKSLTF